MNTMDKPQAWLDLLANHQASRVMWDRLRYWPGNTGLRIGPVRLDHHLMIYVDRGAFDLMLEEEPMTLAAGQLLWLSPGTLRSMWVPKGMETVNYRLHFSVCNQGETCRLHLPYIVARDCRDLLPVFQRLFDLEHHPGAYRGHALRGILLDLSARVFERIRGEEPEGPLRRFSLTQRRMIDTYIADHINEPLNAARLARLVELSQGYFSRLFKDTYGVAPRTHIKQERVQVAAQHLLETDHLVSEVAWQVGYRNAFLFSRQFREVLHCSPSEYRARHR